MTNILLAKQQKSELAKKELELKKQLTICNEGINLSYCIAGVCNGF